MPDQATISEVPALNINVAELADGRFIARSPQHPMISWIAPTKELAAKRLLDAIDAGEGEDGGPFTGHSV